jgi:hypothetical protein
MARALWWSAVLVTVTEGAAASVLAGVSIRLSYWCLPCAHVSSLTNAAHLMRITPTKKERRWLRRARPEWEILVPALRACVKFDERFRFRV